MDEWKEKICWYNRFFYANLCHVCKKFSSDTALKQCSGCRMIVYCSKDHQTHHWPLHREFCKTIRQVRKTCTAIATANHLMPNTMKVLKEMILQIMDRPLVLYETQMLKYPKMCLACYKIIGELKECAHCRTVWFCEQHTNKRHKSDICNFLKLCFESDLSLYQNLGRPSLTDAYMRNTSYDKYFRDMKEFINIYGDIEKDDSEASPDILQIEQSVYLTRPLSVYHGMHVLDYISTCKKQTTLVLHVLAANEIEKAFLRAWELLLHIFPNLHTLQLILIGQSESLNENQNVCEKCKQEKKTFLVQWQYNDNKNRLPPDLVILFGQESYGEIPRLYNVWKSSLTLVSKSNLPLLFCYSNVNATTNKIINTTLDKTIEVRESDNPFASLKPYRAYEFPPFPVFYDNMYVNVYKASCT